MTLFCGSLMSMDQEKKLCRKNFRSSQEIVVQSPAPREQQQALRFRDLYYSCDPDALQGHEQEFTLRDLFVICRALQQSTASLPAFPQSPAPRLPLRIRRQPESLQQAYVQGYQHAQKEADRAIQRLTKYYTTKLDMEYLANLFLLKKLEVLEEKLSEKNEPTIFLRPELLYSFPEADRNDIVEEIMERLLQRSCFRNGVWRDYETDAYTVRIPSEKCGLLEYLMNASFEAGVTFKTQEYQHAIVQKMARFQGALTMQFEKSS